MGVCFFILKGFRFSALWTHQQCTHSFYSQSLNGKCLPRARGLKPSSLVCGTILGHSENSRSKLGWVEGVGHWVYSWVYPVPLLPVLLYHKMKLLLGHLTPLPRSWASQPRITEPSVHEWSLPKLPAKTNPSPSVIFTRHFGYCANTLWGQLGRFLLLLWL